ncbi:uncharacterized protein LOC102804888 [Saccoglossus kowalevskii]|uniref:Uncharacterized protein LOC102804888 n=1 Tax=Saccoglossus kowalevskii TaxID=10224 RepID=A0ABM0MDJ9_SACKO|nr:PREDICTED: uncharacterized protein LOC102804888 [Saccoglossus kowalevskii]
MSQLRCRKPTTEDSFDVPVIVEATEDQKCLTTEKKLQLIEDDMVDLYEFCVKAGFSVDDIGACYSPIFGVIREANIAKLIAYGKVAAVSLVVGIILCYCSWSYQLICSFIRITFLKTLPYWDWRYLYADKCLVYNPYQNSKSLNESDCKTCEEFMTPIKINDVTEAEMTKYLHTNTPVIVTDAVKDWEAYRQFNSKFIAKLFIRNPVLSTSYLCKVVSMDPDNPFLLHVLRGMAANKHWNIYWQNCAQSAVKILRQYYTRPYFMPPMVEFGSSNWLVLTSGYNVEDVTAFESQYNRITFYNIMGFQSSDEMAHTMTWFAQLKGNYLITLIPNAVCTDICHKVHIILNPGEMLVFSNDMWILEYKVSGSADAVALAANGNWD